MLWVYFQIRPCIAKRLSFLSRVRLGCHHSQNSVCWKLVTATLLFIKLGNLLPGYKSPQSARSGLDLKETFALHPPENDFLWVHVFQGGT